MDTDKKIKGEEEVQRQRKARIRLTCKNVDSIERGSLLIYFSFT
jgi:hypothetical protein